MIKPVDNWKTVLGKAWSVRFMGLAVVLGALQAAALALPYAFKVVELSPMTTAIAVMVINTLAIGARLIAQKGMD